MRSLLTSALTAALLTAPAAAKIIYVDANVLTAGNGSSWTNAYASLSAALAISSAGDEVWVAVGLYSGGFTIPAGVTVRGQFLGNLVSGPVGYHSLLQRTFRNRTVLSGGGSQRVITMGAGSVLDGFDVSSGQAAAPGGGGILIDGVDCTVRNCQIKFNNDSVGNGAAMLVRNGAKPRIETCAFYINGDASSGAAIDVDGAGGTYVNLTVDFNQNSGIRLKNALPTTIVNCAFTNNGAASGSTAYGVAKDDASSDPALHHDLFHGNNSGLFLQGANAVTTVGALNALGFASANIDGDPLYNGLNDYRIQTGSPLIDAGDQATSPLRTQDLFDQPRHLDGNLDGSMVIDIGAAEFSNAELTIPVDTHMHVHLGVSGTNGLPVLLLVSVNENPPGLLVPPAGEVFVGLSGAIVFPYGTIPTQASQVLIYPASGLLPGVSLYWQAIVSNGTGINLSNPSIHITN